MRILARPHVPSWFEALVGVSIFLVLVTLVSYPLSGHGALSRALFWVGLGGENNIGSWWSGMLLALGAVFAFDGFANAARPQRERYGWCALGFALLLLSFDEVASLHEFLFGYSRVYLALFGAVGLGLVGYAMVQLRRAGVAKRALGLLVVAFGLLATVPAQEVLQGALDWPDQVVYGARAALEEGTEIAAMLLFIWVLRANSESLLRGTRDLFSTPARCRGLIRAGALVLWPALTAATFVLPRPGGPADWLAELLFLLCALLALRVAVLDGRMDARSKSLIAFYLAASAASNAVAVTWDPLVLQTHVSLRGIVFALLIAASALLLRANGRRMNLPRALLGAAAVAASAVVWSSSQLLWCGLPPLFALWLYLIESKVVATQSVPAGTLAPRAA